MEHAFHLLVNGHVHNAKQQLSVALSWRYGKQSASQSPELKLIHAYCGFLDYLVWSTKRPPVPDAGTECPSRVTSVPELSRPFLFALVEPFLQCSPSALSNSFMQTNAVLYQIFQRIVEIATRCTATSDKPLWPCRRSLNSRGCGTLLFWLALMWVDVSFDLIWLRICVHLISDDYLLVFLTDARILQRRRNGSTVAAKLRL